MTDQARYDWDVFVSYSHADAEWVQNELLPRLRQVRVGEEPLRVCIDTKSFEVGAPIVTEVERAVQNSRKTVLVLTPDYLKSDWATFENVMLAALDPANQQRRLIPLLVKKCKLPLRIRSLICVDLAGAADVEGQFHKMLNAIGASEESQLEELYAEAQKYYGAQRWQPALDHLRQAQAMRPAYRDVEQLIAKAQQELRRVAQQRLLAGGAGVVAVLVLGLVLLRNVIWPPQPPAPYTSPRPIAFVSDREGNDDIYTVEADGSNLQRLTKDAGSDAQPVWAPDGTRLAFVSDRDDIPEIYVMDRTGAQVKRVTNTRPGGKWYAWSPDSSQLVFEWAWDGTSHRDIYTVQADGSAQTRLTDGMGVYWNASWSADGQRIVFVVQRKDAEIMSMDAHGNGWTALTDNETWEQLPTWSPDGSRIAFVTHRNGVWCAYAMRSDGTGEYELLQGIEPNLYAAWSPTGDRIAVAALRDQQHDIYVMNADGSAEIRLTDNPANDDAPAWSPDGKQIAFQSDRDGHREIYIKNADGSGEERRLTTGGGQSPAWGH
jgi:Tol biopolymer transport system component